MSRQIGSTRSLAAAAIATAALLFGPGAAQASPGTARSGHVARGAIGGLGAAGPSFFRRTGVRARVRRDLLQTHC
jgi:hypothetical protein